MDKRIDLNMIELELIDYIKTQNISFSQTFHLPELKKLEKIRKIGNV